MKTAIQFQTTKGATFKGEKSGSNLIVKGAKFYITDNVLFTNNDKDAQTFLSAMNVVAPEGTQVTLYLSKSEYLRLDSVLRPELAQARKVSEDKLLAIFAKAKETGLRQLISRNSNETTGEYIQLVNEYTYAMPDGTKKTETEETH